MSLLLKTALSPKNNFALSWTKVTSSDEFFDRDACMVYVLQHFRNFKYYSGSC